MSEKLTKTCPYKINKGGRKGQICGLTVRSKTSEYCSHHKQSLERRDEALKRLMAKQQITSIGLDT